MRKIVRILIACLSGLLITACSSNNEAQVTIPNRQTNKMVLAKYQMRANPVNKQRAKQLSRFIKANMLAKQGIYTNLSQQKQPAELATGHEMLSESSGMWLTYLALNKQTKPYQKFLNQTDQTFNQGNQYSYRYNPENNQLANVNATLDDLRIIRSMVVYDAVNNSVKYQKTAAKRFAKLKPNVIQHGQLTDFYDVNLKKGTSTGSLAYFDLLTLKYFESATNQGRKDYQRQLQVVNHGYLGDVFPLYAENYNWQTKQYSQQNLNGSEALVVLLHLAEVGKIKSTSLNWLRLQIDQHQLANTYSITGQIVDKNQSPANYGLAAMIFANVNDQAYYQKAMKLVWKSQVKKAGIKVNGGIGIAKNNEFYSYNNLVSLLASQMAK